MNTIEAVVSNSHFVDEPHLRFVIDGEPLAELLDRYLPGRNLKGLVPTTINWLENMSQQEEVWRRFANRKPGTEVVPILCCPDDLDFSCSLVVADALFDSNCVTWVQLGFDMTSFELWPSGIGSSVDWLPGIGPFKFEKEQYEVMAKTFEQLGPKRASSG